MKLQNCLSFGGFPTVSNITSIPKPSQSTGESFIPLQSLDYQTALPLSLPPDDSQRLLNWGSADTLSPRGRRIHVDHLLLVAGQTGVLLPAACLHLTEPSRTR